MLEHGGRLKEAARKYGIPTDEWIDLSTGVNPDPYPVPGIPSSIWQRLPEENDGLEDAAAIYYGGKNLLATAGSQAAIQVLPFMRETGSVVLLEPGYNEHAHAWQRAGHRIRCLDSSTGDSIVSGVDSLVSQADVLLICNPNNPTGSVVPPERLKNWSVSLSRRGGWLIVDEAFVDATPEASVLPNLDLSNLIVLRSTGKFFGLAGARVGFVFAWPELLQGLRERLGPWSIPGPSRMAARVALLDGDWQSQARQSLLSKSRSLSDVLSRFGLCPTGSSAFFQWVQCDQSGELHRFLATRGILTRLFGGVGVRFGLPGDGGAWERLHDGLSQWRRLHHLSPV